MPQHPKLRTVDLDLHDASYDMDEREQEHWNIFGHLPPMDPNERCDHPLHAAIRREMNGLTVEVPFDPEAVVSDDSEVAREKQERYDLIYNATRQFQQEVEQEDKLKRMQEAGLIPIKFVT